MNDDFLHRLRREPSAKFLNSLKARLDRQSTDQRRARRTLFRTAVLAALIGGSAVAVAFVAWRGAPHALRMARTHDAGVEQTGHAKNIISAPAGGGAARSGAGAESSTDRAVSADALPAGAPTSAAAEASRAGFTVAGVGGLILNVDGFLRTSLLLGGANRPKTTQTTATQAIAMLCHVRGSAGAESATAEVVGTDRRISEAELATCKRNGVMRVTELRPGYEAVVLVRSQLYGAPALSARDIFLALAAKVPDLPDRPYRLIDNPYRIWNAVDSALSQEQIEVLGPPLSSPVAAVFRQTVMEAGCVTFPELAALKEKNPAAFDKVCHSVREDGLYRDITKVSQANLAPLLDTYPNAMALLSFSEAKYRPNLIAASINGVTPNNETIMAESYLGARPLYLYVNATRVTSLRPFYDFAGGLERAAHDPSPDMSLVTIDIGQERTYMQNLAALPELKL